MLLSFLNCVVVMLLGTSSLATYREAAPNVARPDDFLTERVLEFDKNVIDLPGAACRMLGVAGAQQLEMFMLTEDAAENSFPKRAHDAVREKGHRQFEMPFGRMRRSCTRDLVQKSIQNYKTLFTKLGLTRYLRSFGTL